MTHALHVVTQPNALDFTAEDVDGDLQIVQEVRPEDLDTTIGKLNDAIQKYF